MPKLESGTYVCSNIYMILRLGGELVENQCFYHLYYFINPLSISNNIGMEFYN
jgi:hypothetical protein